MAQFRKKIAEDYSSDDSSDDSSCNLYENSTLDDLFAPPPPKKRRLSKMPIKLREYDTQEDVCVQPKELSWCIVEWEGEDSFQCLSRKSVSTADGEDPRFEPTEKVLAIHGGKPYKATIAVVSATKKAAERAYKDLQRNAGKQQDRTKLSKNDAAGKNPKTPKKKCEKRDEKAIQQQIQRRQMQETLSKMQDTPNCSATGFTPAPVAKRIGIFSDDDDNPCCKQCRLNEAAVKRNGQELQIIHQGISQLQGELAALKLAIKHQSVPKVSDPTPTPPRCPPVPSSLPSEGLPKAVGSSTSTCSSGTMVEIPHHLKSRAASSGALKKATRILATTVFTVAERFSCTVSGSSNKSSEDVKRPQFDQGRIYLIHDFLRKTFPKSYCAPDVNRVIGQVAIESRGGRHSSNDSVVMSLLAN